MVFFLNKEILGFSTTKNSSPEIFEGIFWEEIWEGFLVIYDIFLVSEEFFFWIFHPKNSSEEVIEGIFGKEIWGGF